MPNIATVLKDEIARISRKESRRLVEPLKKQLASQKRDLAALKGERTDLKREIAALRKSATGTGTANPSPEPRAAKARFSATGLQSMRRKLAISAEEMGRIIGVSGQSIYNWEQAKTRPREAQLHKIASLRGVGKREIQALSEAASVQAAKSAKKPRRKKAQA
jgi:DNA-binding transcriptional regulator YiaG